MGHLAVRKLSRDVFGLFEPPFHLNAIFAHQMSEPTESKLGPGTGIRADLLNSVLFSGSRRAHRNKYSNPHARLPVRNSPTKNYDTSPDSTHTGNAFVPFAHDGPCFGNTHRRVCNVCTEVKKLRTNPVQCNETLVFSEETLNMTPIWQCSSTVS